MNKNTKKTADVINFGILTHKLFSILPVLICLTTLSSFTAAATFYVATDGDDSNLGTIASPWLTINYAMSNASPVSAGDTVLVRGGTYQEEVILEKNGTNGNPIILKAYSGETVIMDGSSILPNGWTQCQSNEPDLTVLGVTNPNYANIYKTTVPDSLLAADPMGIESESLIFDGSTRKKLACEPTRTNSWGQDVTEFIPLETEAWNHSDGSASSPDAGCTPAENNNCGVYSYLIDSDFFTEADNYWKGAYVDIWSHARNNVVVRKKISDYDQGTKKILFDSLLDARIWYGTEPDAYTIMNHPHIIDAADEYYLKDNDNGTHTLYLYSNSAPVNISIAVIRSAFYIRSNGNYITIQDLTIRNYKDSAIDISGTADQHIQNFYVKDCVISNTGSHGLSLYYLDNSIVDGCNISHTDTAGRGIGMARGTGNSIKNCNISNISSSDISFYTQINGSITNNILYESLGPHGNGLAIYLNCENVLVASNIFYNSNFALQDIDKATVYNNCFIIDEGLVINMWPGTVTGDFLFAYNTLTGSYNNGALSIRDSSDGNIRIINNIIDGVGNPLYSDVTTNNIYTALSWQQRADYGWALGTGESLEETLDNIFIDYANDNCRLKKTGPAVDAGTDISAYLTQAKIDFPDYDFDKDIDGNARTLGAATDAGAYEFIGLTANAGADQYTKDPNVTLNGSLSESTDPNKPITRYLWTCDPAINGGDPNLYDGANDSVTVTLPNDATAHTITLTVFDGDGNSDSDTVDITVYDYSVNTSSDPNGSVTIQGEEGRGEGNFYYGTGDIIDIIAEPISNLYEFENWTVDPAYTGDPNYFTDPNNPTTDIQMNQDYAITANFRLKPTLTVTSGVGGSVSAPGVGVYPYPTGTTGITVTAVPAAGYRFVSWSGSGAASLADDTAASTTLSSISSNLTLEPIFIKTYTITISSTTNGSVTTPGEAAYTDDIGTVMAIEATKTPPSGYFINWTGTAVDAGAVANPNASPTTVTYSGDYTLIANFGIDETGPTVTANSPTAGYLYAPTNSLVTLTVADAGTGVDPASVNIVVSTPNDPNVLVYTGDVDEYNSATGTCRRAAVSGGYKYFYDPNTPFNSEDLVTVTVDANDLQTPTSNDTIGETYSFEVTTPIFGVNDYVNYDGTTAASNADTVTYPGDGAILAVWQQINESGTYDIYYGELPYGEYYFSADDETNLTDEPLYNQVNPLIDTHGTDLYIVWQEGEPNGLNNIVIYYTDDANWVGPLDITDPNNTTDQTNPAMAIDSTGKIYVTWLDEESKIKVATSNDPNTGWTINEVESAAFAPDTQPAIAIDENDTAYIVWANNGVVYGAASNNWGGRQIIDNSDGYSGNLANPVIATESTGTVLHILWDDGAEVYHCQTTDGLTSPYTITDITGADGAQTNPTIAVSGTSVYAAWKDTASGNPDIFYAEKTGTTFGSNIQINDDGGSTAQLEPVINLDSNNQPYILWSDNRTSKQSIYYAAATFIGPTLKSQTVDSAAAGNTIVEIDGTNPGVIDDANDVVVTIPAGALPADTTITIARLYNPPSPPTNSLGLFYEFGPSGLTFTNPVTITIPHPAADDNAAHDTWTIYWFDYATETWKTDGTTFVSHNTSSDPHTITFTTTHFTSFGVVGSTGPITPPGGDSGSGAGGGGCSVSPYGGGSILEFLLPYALIGLIVAGFNLKSKRKKSA